MAELDPAQLHALRAAVDGGTFDAAARALHVTPSAISQRVKALENSVGRVLLVRSKPVQVTKSGQAVLRYARQLEVLSEDLGRLLGSGASVAEDPAPITVPLAVNGDSLATWVLAALADLEPRVCFDFYREDEDHTHELLRAGTVMAAVTTAAKPLPGCRTTRLGRMRYRPMASAAFLDRWFPAGVTAAELARVPMVCFDRVDTMQDRYLRRRSRQHLEPPRHYVPSSGEMLAAVVFGYGWGMVPDLQADELIERGELVGIDSAAAIDVTLYWQRWRLDSPALDLVSAAVHRYAAARLR
jgi:LysR family transcriptional regulator, chromosome initiation inhibitor